MAVTMFLDTTNAYLTIILLDKEDQLIDRIQIWNYQKHSDTTTFAIDKMLTKNALDWFKIKKLYLSIGPGSYTGIRVAITICKIMKVINDGLAVFVTNSLLLQAGNEQVISIITATSKEFYVAVYDNLQPLVLEQVVNDSNLLLIKKQWSNFTIVKDYHQVDAVANFLQIKQTCKKIRNVDDLEPLYLKPLTPEKFLNKQ